MNRVKGGDACPNGCLVSQRWERPRRPELVVQNDDGELSCPTCWDYFGNALVADDERGKAPPPRV